MPASALVITHIGAAGSDGSTGLVGTNGAAGAGAQTRFASADLTSVATAIGGNGGRGGASRLPVAPGGRGGNGGAAATAVDSSGTGSAESERAGTGAATGGNGGDGGAGVIRGDGGRGGAASARLMDHSSIPQEGISRYLGTSAANGGNGGQGLRGGGGGAAESVAETSNGNIFTNVTTANAAGGNGGGGVLRGGDGGAARAANRLSTGGQPTESRGSAEAIGGAGGSASSGVNGDGGEAHAEATGTFGARALQLGMTAVARGGASGTGALLGFARGDGGNAVALANNQGFPSTSAGSLAVGGAGVVRGGDALASSRNDAPVNSSASARAEGGAGKYAGAALARSQALAAGGLPGSAASANYAGNFARFAFAGAGGDIDGPFNGGSYLTEARAGDTRALQGQLPVYGDEETNSVRVRSSIAASQQEVDSELAGSPAVAAAFANSIWGSGEVHESENPFNQVFLSYQFDATAFANPQHLWLGLLDADFSADTFTITGEGVTLFDGADYTDLFDDQLFDLGSWANMVGSDGLFDLQFRFANFSGDLHFAFADPGTTNAVPEPPVLLLLLPGLGLLMALRRASASGQLTTSAA